jgi:NitT/TauT family transport system ATP-binding protein
VLEVKEVSFAYRKGTHTPAPVLDNVSFSVQRGEALAILGASGIGKTTLARLCAGLQRPTSGLILHRGAPVTGPSSSITVSFQSYPCFPWLTVERNVLFGLEETRRVDSAHRGYAQWLLQEVGLHDARGMYPRELSGGMLQRLSLARCLVLEPDVLILDEPFSALDQGTKTDLIELILELQSVAQFTLVVILHDLKDAYSLVDRVVVLAGKPAKSLLELELSGRDFNAFQKTVLQAISDGRQAESSEGCLLSLLACIRSREVPPRQLMARALARKSLAAIGQRVSPQDSPFIANLLRDRDPDRLRIGILLAESLAAQPEVWQNLKAIWTRSLAAQARMDLVSVFARTSMTLDAWIEQEAVGFVAERWEEYVLNVGQEISQRQKLPARATGSPDKNGELPAGRLPRLRLLAVACATGSRDDARALASRLSLDGISFVDRLLKTSETPTSLNTI